MKTYKGYVKCAPRRALTRARPPRPRPPVGDTRDAVGGAAAASETPGSQPADPASRPPLRAPPPRSTWTAGEAARFAQVPQLVANVSYSWDSTNAVVTFVGTSAPGSFGLAGVGPDVPKCVPRPARTVHPLA